MEIVAYQQEQWTELLQLFSLNIPQFFAESEIDELKEYIDGHWDTYFLVMEEEQLIGAGGYHYPDEATGRLSWYFFDPAYTGKGLGSKLVNFCLDQMSAKPGIEQLTVWTFQDAYRFFERFGFQLQRTEKDYWAEGFDLYLMTMPAKAMLKA